MRALLFETVTGQPLLDLQPSKLDWDTGILAPDKITLEIPNYTEWAKATDLRGMLVPRRVGVALQDDAGRAPAAGPIMTEPQLTEDDDGLHHYKVECYGPERLFDGRRIRKYPGWPLLGLDRKPNGVYDMVLAGLEYGTIMKRLVQESFLFRGGALPIEFEPDRLGTRERSYEAVEGKVLLAALNDISELEHGVEYDFVPRISGTDVVSWDMVTGTDSDRIITTANRPIWRLGGEQPDLRKYQRTTMIPGSDRAIFTGGKGGDETMLAQAEDPALTDAGYPTWEIWDSSHATVTEQSTLDGWAQQALATGPIELITFEVRADRVIGARHGDYCEISALDHHDMPNGDYTRRILSIGGNLDNDWRQVTVTGPLDTP